jgi:hypothetical protein
VSEDVIKIVFEQWKKATALPEYLLSATLPHLQRKIHDAGYSIKKHEDGRFLLVRPDGTVAE